MTTPDAPRHLPPTPEERAKTIFNRMAGGSAEGLTQNARPVQQPPRGSDSVGGTVELGEAFSPSISITSTGEGEGSSQSLGFNTIAIGASAYAIGGPDPENLGAVAVGSDARAEGDEALALGASTKATSSGTNWGPVAIGAGAEAHGDAAVAIGRTAKVGTSLAEVGGSAVAIGGGATATNDNDFILGNGNHNVQVPGQFILTDHSTGNQYRLDVTGGSLSLVAYP